MTTNEYEKDLGKGLAYVAKNIDELRQLARRADRKLDDLVEETHRIHEIVRSYDPSEEDELDLGFLNGPED